MAKPLIKLTFKNRKLFEKELDDFLEDTLPDQHLRVQKKIAFDLLGRIIDRTPVGNPDEWAESSLPPPPGYVGGRARANWQISITTPPDNPINAIDPDGGVTQTMGNSKMAAAKPYGTIWIYNNVRYIKRLEDGWSKQARNPNGMVAVSLAEIAAGLGST